MFAFGVRADLIVIAIPAAVSFNFLHCWGMMGLYTGKAMTHKPTIVALALIILSGCAAPAVDRETAGFNADEYSDDLDACRGGAMVSFTLKTVGGTLWGSAKGAVYGVYLGALAGDADEGALIGAIVGGTVGMGKGAQDFLNDQGNTIERCLREKGYDISPA